MRCALIVPILPILDGRCDIIAKYVGILCPQLDFPAPNHHRLRQPGVRIDRGVLQAEADEPLRARKGSNTGVRPTTPVTSSSRTPYGGTELRCLPRVPIRLQLLPQDDIVVPAAEVRHLVLDPDLPESAFLERLYRTLVLCECVQLRMVPALVVEHDLQEELHRLRPVALPPELLLPEADPDVRADVLPVPRPHYAPANWLRGGPLLDHVRRPLRLFVVELFLIRLLEGRQACHVLWTEPRPGDDLPVVRPYVQQREVRLFHLPEADPVPLNHEPDNPREHIGLPVPSRSSHKVLLASAVRPRDEVPHPRTDRGRGLRDWLRCMGDRRERPRELVRSHGRQGVDSSGAAGRGPGLHLLRHRGRLRMGPQRGDPRRGP